MSLEVIRSKWATMGLKNPDPPSLPEPAPKITKQVVKVKPTAYVYDKPNYPPVYRSGNVLIHFDNIPHYYIYGF